MDITIVLISLALICAMIALGWATYIGDRNNDVAEYLLSINNRCFEWCKRHPGEESAYVWFYDVHVKHYSKYLNSVKPLKDEVWFPKDALDKLNS